MGTDRATGRGARLGASAVRDLSIKDVLQLREFSGGWVALQQHVRLEVEPFLLDEYQQPLLQFQEQPVALAEV